MDRPLLKVSFVNTGDSSSNLLPRDNEKVDTFTTSMRE